MADEKVITRMQAIEFLRELRENREIHIAVHGECFEAECMYLHLMYSVFTFYCMGLLTKEEFSDYLVFFFKESVEV